MVVVADAGPLIALAQLRRLDLLRKLFVEVLVPPAVAREVFEARRRAQPGWVRVESPGGSEPSGLRAERIDPGEREALHLAVEHRADLVLADDRRARAAAVRLRLNVTGTVAVLIEARRRGFVRALRPLLDTLLARKFRLSKELHASALASVGE